VTDAALTRDVLMQLLSRLAPRPRQVWNGIFDAGDWHAKRDKDDVSAQRPEIGDCHAREMAAKTALLLASYQLRQTTEFFTLVGTKIKVS
jgi:hypothetical protein